MRRVLALALLAAGIGACAGSPPPDDAFHRLSPPEPARRSAPLLAGSVEVARFSASDALRGRVRLGGVVCGSKCVTPHCSRFSPHFRTL